MVLGLVVIALLWQMTSAKWVGWIILIFVLFLVFKALQVTGARAPSGS